MHNIHKQLAGSISEQQLRSFPYLASGATESMSSIAQLSEGSQVFHK